MWSILGGQALSLIGSAMTEMVLPWLNTVTIGSRSALAVARRGNLAAAGAAEPAGGTLTDRYSRRMRMISPVNALGIVVLIALCLADRIAL